jgi:O-antigen/teichoic acid export membrane protein
LLTGAFLAFFSENAKAASPEALNGGFATGTRVMAFLAFPLCFGTAAILPALVPLFYGHAFAGAVVPATIVVCAAAFGATGSIGTHMIYARERSDAMFFCTIAGAALSILSGFFVIPIYGVMGAAWGRAAVQIFMVAIGCWFIERRLKTPIPFADLGRLVLAAIVCAVAARACLFGLSGPAALPIAITVGALVYGLAVRLLDALPAKDVQRLALVGEYLPQRMRWVPQYALKILSRAHAA